MTNVVKGKTRLKFKTILTTLREDFEIPLSIRIEKEAHIFLCDGADPSKSNCYWFLLQAWSGEKTAVRKCPTNGIPAVNEIYPDPPCEDLLAKVLHPETPKFLFSNKWTHFKLAKEKGKITFSQVKGYNSETKIIEMEDTKDTIDVTHMIIHSKLVNGLWKIHDVNYIYTKETNVHVYIKPPTTTYRNYFCVSLYIIMCATCKMKMALVSGQNVLGEETYNSEGMYYNSNNKPSRWSEIKFMVNTLTHLNTQDVRLLIKTLGEDAQQFWAIDNKVRICQEKEYRVITLSEKASCQLMSEEDNVISTDGVYQNSKSECPENTIGDFCVPCNWIYRDCEKIKVCDSTKCVCSAGYKKTDCYNECETYFYGHGCRKRCGHCYYNSWGTYGCNNINGICNSEDNCLDDYTGPKCDIAPSLIIFNTPPVVTNVSFNEVTVIMKDFNITRGYGSEQPKSYLIQYNMKADDIRPNNAWINLKEYPFGQSVSITITNLEVDTKYLVRSIIISTSGEIYDREVKSVEITTDCLDISKNSVNVLPQNYSAFISITPSKWMCKMERYKISVSLQNGKKFRSVGPEGRNSSGLHLDDLVPFTNYTIFFKTNNNDELFNITFQTKEGVPGRINHLEITNGPSSTTVEISWQMNSINGIFKHYIVKYQHIGHHACNSEQTNSITKPPVMKEIENNYSKIEDLMPYSTYLVSVFAVNTQFEGPAVELKVYTKAASDIYKEEIPQFQKIVEDSKTVEVKLGVDCEKFRGPVSMRVCTTCTSEWCDKENNITTFDKIIGVPILIENLIPFSHYKLQYQFCRDDINCTNLLENQEFRTKSAVPNQVRDLLVYSKNQDSISIRWKPPYPPHGILKDYKIDHAGGYPYRKESKNISITSCELWPDFHCAKISSLQRNVYYTIAVFARNEEPSDYGPSNSTGAYTAIGPSGPPYDLKSSWTSQNDLNLEWKHPNQTNGDIQYFKINVFNYTDRTELNEKLQIFNNSYNLTYYYTIPSEKIVPTTNYTIKISAYNGYDGVKFHKQETSPPGIPEMQKELQTNTISNTTVNITVSPKLRGKTEKLRLILLISNRTSNLGSYPELTKIDLKNLKVIFDCNIPESNHSKIEITVGNEKRRPEYCEETPNPPLIPATKYNITVILINSFGNMSRYKAANVTYTTEGEPIQPSSSLLGLLVLLLLIPLAAILYIKRDKLISIKDNMVARDNTSTEILEVPDDQVPLSTLSQDLKIQVEKKNIKSQPKTPNETKIYSKPIKITEFEEYVKEMIKNGELERQHALFPRGQTKPWTYGTSKENKSKNRYNNLIAYDHSRVVLEKVNGDAHSDYINASYINGHKVPRAYIATQGPKVATLNDFWRMIWQENIRHIANLANVYEGGKKKLEKYWPEINETLHFGDITVQHVSRKVFADYEHRVFTMSRNKETRKMEQLHFSSWPDHGVPLYSQSLVPFLQTILQIPLSSKSPVLVHCSAGVGRTGTILLCDICLRMAAREGSIDVLRNLQLLREQRPNMVDNVEQYKLAHLVVLECLVGLHTSIPCNEIEESIEKLMKNNSLTSQMRYLKDTQWQDQAMKSVGQTPEEVPIVPEKNRFQNIIPEIQGRIFISRYPQDDDTSSYINAVKVDGFRSPGRFIVTQQPMPNTIGDFWRLIEENNISVIISLNETNPKDKTTCNFWPTSKHPQIEAVPHITLEHVDALPLEYYDVITVHLHANSRKEHFPVKIVSMKNWPPKTNCPKNIKQFLAFWEESDSVARRSTPVVVTCYDGVKASGLYVAMSFIIEKMKLEQVCDVCQAVRTVRHNREEFIQDIEQFEFLYKAAALYINGFESYANFN